MTEVIDRPLKGTFLKQRYINVSILLWITLIGFILGSCSSTDRGREVVIYTSVDQTFSEPILDEFESQTGIKVLAVYDVEAAKTTGLVNRIIAEGSNPQADVFWSGEFAQTILLKERNLLIPYHSPNSAGIPQQYKDRDGYWSSMGGRARVIIINTELIPGDDGPTSLDDFLNPAWPAEGIGIAYPLFGTTSTHAAALYALFGPVEGRIFFEALQSRGIAVVDGNSVVRDLVASGQLAFGLTDTDDACGAIERGAPVRIVFPDQGVGEIGTLIIPNTVGLIASSPNPDAGKELIDFLLSLDTEAAMIRSGWSHLALRDVDVEQTCLEDLSIQGMQISLSEVYEQLDAVQADLAEIFLR
jgi:iron(III) transport system substrate-binding protein